LKIMSTDNARRIAIRTIVLSALFLHSIGVRASAITPSGQEEVTKADEKALADRAPALLLVMDRNRVLAGEDVVLTIVARRGVFTGGEVEMYASPVLHLTPVPVADRSHVRRYNITAAKAGEFVLLVRATITGDSEKIATSDVSDAVMLTVIAGSGRFAAVNGGVIIGAIVGFLSSLGGLYAKEFVESRTARRNRTRWLSNELVGRLEAALLDIGKRRPVSYQPWMDELYGKYFSTLRAWGGNSRTGEHVSHELVEIESLLRDYNDRLKGISMDDALVRGLEERIRGVQRTLSSN
jgi:hypothetical protein